MDVKSTLHDFLSTEEQKLLIELVPDEILLLDPASQRIIYVNHPPQGLKLDEFVGKDYLSLSPINSRPMVQAALSIVGQQKRIIEHETELVITGEPCWMLVRMIPVVRDTQLRSEERRVGKECRFGWSLDRYIKNGKAVLVARLR